MEETVRVVADGGGYWPGLIVPAVIVIIVLLTAAAALLVTRGPRGSAPEASTSVRPSVAAEPAAAEAQEEPGEEA